MSRGKISIDNTIFAISFIAFPSIIPVCMVVLFLMNTRTMTKCFGCVLFTNADNMYVAIHKVHTYILST